MDKYLKELEEYKYNVKYYFEKSKDIQIINKEIDKLKINCESNIKEDICKTLGNEKNEITNIFMSIKKVEERINNLSQPYKNIFYYRYIKNLNFDEIAKNLNYSTKRIYQLHKLGLDIYCKNIELEDFSIN